MGTRPGLQSPQAVGEGLKLRLASHGGAEKLVDGDGLVSAFRHRTVDEAKDVALSGRASDRVADQKRRAVMLAQLLDARREVHRMAQDSVVHAVDGADIAHDGFARME